MVSGVAGEPGATFFALTPDRVLDAVEVGGLRCTGRCLPLRAFENRVYEVELEDERRLVVKFYRPGRWSRETILDEHAFLADLAAAEVPAVAPLDLGTGSTLGEIEGILYAAFPKVRGGSEDARKERLDLLEGYELFREFDRSTLSLCEALRAMRIVYMSGWIARRWDDPSFPQAFPMFRNHNYWNQEYEELLQIAETLG